MKNSSYPPPYARELPRRKHTIFRTWQKFEIKNLGFDWWKGQEIFHSSSKCPDWLWEAQASYSLGTGGAASMVSKAATT